MTTLYLFSGYFVFHTLTSPSQEWIEQQMIKEGIDVSTYTEFSPYKIFLLAVLLIGWVIGELKSHRFFIAQTFEESKYPWKPQRCLMTLFVGLIIIWNYPYSRIWQLIFFCTLQRVTMNHLYTLQVKMLNSKALMIFVFPYILGYVFKIIIVWYNIYMAGLLIIMLFYQGVKESNIWKIICGILYTSAGILFCLAILRGCTKMFDYALTIYLVVWFVWFKLYYDFMGPHLKENAKLWKNRGYNFTK